MSAIFSAWGLGLDIIGLWLLPLLGYNQVLEALVPFQANIELKYNFAACGVARLAYGLYPNEKGSWLACLLSMIFEVAYWYQVQDKCPKGINDCVPAFLLCGGTALYMLLNPPSKKEHKN